VHARGTPQDRARIAVFNGAAMRVVNGFACRTCGEEELAEHGLDPAHPERAFARAEVRAPANDMTSLGVNRANARAMTGNRLSLRA
jgi:hypothetical protein